MARHAKRSRLKKIECKSAEDDGLVDVSSTARVR